MQRVQKLIASSGYCSRRKAEILISEGIVSVNGKPITIGDKATEDDEITINGKKIDTNKQKIYLLLNKPRNYVCTTYDPAGRKTIMELISGFNERLYTVGRLDYDASGAIFLTNDGDFAQKVSHPSFECPKRYMVKLRRSLSDSDIKALGKKVVLDGQTVEFDMNVIVPNRVSITVHVGMHKVIKRLFKTVGNYVRKLKRISIGPVEIGELKEGEYRELTPREISYFKELT